ncbi:MAG TPA: AMP-binding protein [Mycobacteriales bacterium]|nr:AMP-binding protein [Mycobacteriales bacterium]
MAARNLADLVRAAADLHPDKRALIDADATLSWRELDEYVDRLALGLLAAGRVAGDRVGILLPNGIPFAATYFGVLRAGLVAVPLNPAYTASELSYQLADAAVSALVVDAERTGVVDGFDADGLLVVDQPDGAWDRLLAAGAAADAAALGRVTTGAEDLALLLYTSGTTGRPRGAMLSHRALLANLNQISQLDPPVFSPDDVGLLVLPLFHVYGLNCGLGMVAWSAATGVLADRFDPVTTLALVREHQVTTIVGAPPMYLAWSMLPDLAASLSSVRLMLSGAAALPPAVFEAVDAAAHHPIYEGYGLTETAPVLTTTLGAEPKPGSVGRPLPGVEIRLLDEHGREVDESDPGEIVVRGANLFSGYWPDGDGGPDADGWFRTGDIAYADADGDLHLVDRTRELIIVSGFNVYPREVEATLLDHPDVEDVAVVGVAHPYTGESVKALVVPKSGTTPTADALIEFAASRLARFKCPTTIEFVDELPHSVTGKVAKGRLREAAEPTS